MSDNSAGAAVTHPGTKPGDDFTGALYLKLAGRRFAIEGIPAGWQSSLPARLLNCRIEGSSGSDRSIRIELSEDDGLRPVSEPHDLNETTHLSFGDDEIGLESDWCKGSFSIASNAPVSLQVHVGARPWFCDVLENLLRVLMAYDVLQRGGVMLHCAAIVRHERAAILFGHSGAGKSTSSAMALEKGCSVISDDINIVEPVNDGWQVVPVPFSGTLNKASDVVSPVSLGGLFRLHQSDEDRVEPCSLARAVSLLIGSSPFVNQDSQRADQLVDILARLAKDCGVKDLFLTRSDMFLNNVF